MNLHCILEYERASHIGSSSLFDTAGEFWECSRVCLSTVQGIHIRLQFQRLCSLLLLMSISSFYMIWAESLLDRLISSCIQSVITSNNLAASSAIETISLVYLRWLITKNTFSSRKVWIAIIYVYFNVQFIIIVSWLGCVQCIL